jgi:putative hydrolase of the HAD superfamily
MERRWDAVVFDYGRVLSLAPSVDEMQQFAGLIGLSEPPFFEIYSATRDEYDRGRHDCREHWQRFAEAAGVAISDEHLPHIVECETLMWLRANPEALELAREIRAAGARIAILSNIPHDLLHDVQSRFDWLDEFEVQVWSCEHGVIKPDAAIYQICLDALGCDPQRTLFFDDRPNNVEGARQAGMEAHVFESVEQARAIVSAGVELRTEQLRSEKLSADI